MFIKSGVLINLVYLEGLFMTKRNSIMYEKVIDCIEEYNFTHADYFLCAFNHESIRYASYCVRAMYMCFPLLL